MLNKIIENFTMLSNYKHFSEYLPEWMVFTFIMSLCQCHCQYVNLPFFVDLPFKVCFRQPLLLSATITVFVNVIVPKLTFLFR